MPQRSGAPPHGDESILWPARCADPFYCSDDADRHSFYSAGFVDTITSDGAYSMNDPYTLHAVTRALSKNVETSSDEAGDLIQQSPTPRPPPTSDIQKPSSRGGGGPRNKAQVLSSVSVHSLLEWLLHPQLLSHYMLQTKVWRWQRGRHNRRVA